MLIFWGNLQPIYKRHICFKKTWIASYFHSFPHIHIHTHLDPSDLKVSWSQYLFHQHWAVNSTRLGKRIDYWTFCISGNEAITPGKSLVSLIFLNNKVLWISYYSHYVEMGSLLITLPTAGFLTSTQLTLWTTITMCLEGTLYSTHWWSEVAKEGGREKGLNRCTNRFLGQQNYSIL